MNETARTWEHLIPEPALLAALGVKRTTLYQWRLDGLPWVKLDSRHLAYWRGDLEKFLAERRTFTAES
ncbi:MAG TPA: hypothetical protein VM695_10140 [Phycisphaerae bacterium]|nr:hypothetical protein [Phycisphaerae bacterium]